MTIVRGFVAGIAAVVLAAVLLGGIKPEGSGDPGTGGLLPSAAQSSQEPDLMLQVIGYGLPRDNISIEELLQLVSIEYRVGQGKWRDAVASEFRIDKAALRWYWKHDEPGYDGTSKVTLSAIKDYTSGLVHCGIAANGQQSYDGPKKLGCTCEYPQPGAR